MIEVRRLDEMPPGWEPGAVWLRVSSDAQDESNQEPDVERYCAHHRIWVVEAYVLHDVSAYKGEQEAKLQALLESARRGMFRIVVTWAVDRLERRGIEYVLRLVRLLRERKCRVASVQEPWLDGSDQTTDLLLSLHAWMAEQESRRKSERIKAGLARRKKEGKPVGGRVAGSTNRRPRPELKGEAAGWSDERRLEAARRNHRRKCPAEGCMETSAHPVNEG